MITEFKIFENINTLPKMGDYVIINDSLYIKELKSFFSSNIGRIVNKYTNNNEELYVVKFDNIPTDIKEHYFGRFSNTKDFSISKFKCWTKEKEELEVIVNSNKYNL